MSDHEGKVGIVTGAASGMGRAMVSRLARDGAKVLAADKSEFPGDCFAGDGDVAVFACDVSDESQVEAMFEHCRDRFGSPDILCNNAGVAPSGTPIHETSLDEWDRVVNINLRGAFIVLKHGVAAMMARGGAIINTASIGAFRASALGHASYLAAKGGVLMLTRAAALEYAGNNLRVNAICPGPIRTGMMEGITPEMVELYSAQVPLGRLGTPDDVAALASFLASDDAGFITGAAYIVDGGICAG